MPNVKILTLWIGMDAHAKGESCIVELFGAVQTLKNSLKEKMLHLSRKHDENFHGLQVQQHKISLPPKKKQ